MHILQPTIAQHILNFNKKLAQTQLTLPPGYALQNPLNGPESQLVREVSTSFYQKFYDDRAPRRLILGSSPARQGSAVTGVPFADTVLLSEVSGAQMGGYSIGKGPAGFLDQVIEGYGGREKFYSDFVMNFVFPIGLVRQNERGRYVNANYYENRELLISVRQFIVETLKNQLEYVQDTSVCFCIGSGENFHFLSELNEQEKFFGRIEPLAHPRYIAQYNPTKIDEYLEKYLRALQV